MSYKFCSIWIWVSSILRGKMGTGKKTSWEMVFMSSLLVEGVEKIQSYP